MRRSAAKSVSGFGVDEDSGLSRARAEPARLTRTKPTKPTPQKAARQMKIVAIRPKTPNDPLRPPYSTYIRVPMEEGWRGQS